MRKLFFILFLLLPGVCLATHIVGGELNYTLLSNNRYKISLKLYIDCYNGQPGAIAQDRFANIGVYRADSNLLMPNLCFAVERGLPVRVSKTNYNCIKIAPNACVDAYYYDTVITLPYLKGGYILSFQRCCRNITILNLVAPDATGENIWVKVTDTADIGPNSNPLFTNLPPNFLCTNAPLIFDHSATDAEGDSLVYEFFHPFTGGDQITPRPDFSQFEPPPFSQVVFQTGYNYGMAINSIPMASIHPKTGLLKITPTISGQFVVGIIVYEYRNGMRIGFTQRDYQFNVQQCVFETTSAFASPDVNCDREVFFTNNSNNATSYLWNYGDSSTSADTSVNANGYYKYPKSGTYTVKLIAKNGNCQDSLIRQVIIIDNITYKLPKDTLLCSNGTARLFPDKCYPNASYLWNTGSTDSAISVSNEGQYWLRVVFGNCVKYDTCNISMDHQEIKFISDSLRCDPVSKQFEARLMVKGNYINIAWFSNPNQLPDNYKDSVALVHQKGYFKIQGEKSNKCPYSDSLLLEGDMSLSIFKFANVFTPDNDGINDFYPEKDPPYYYHLTIFNRWGLKIYESENIPWNSGSFPNGTYYYFIEANGCGESVKTHGVVKLIKD